MQVEKKVNGNTTLVATGENTIELFECMAQMEEVFSHESCGKCSGENLRCVVRKATDAKGKKEFKYFEMHCTNPKCRAKLHFGQSDSFIYPKRYQLDDENKPVKDEDGKNIVAGKWGWVIYNPTTGKEE